MELDVHPFSLRETLERGVVMVRERATEDGVRVSFSADPDVDVVDGDERRIKQAIFNLLSNAVKFTPAGGEIDVNATRENGEVRISVADTGPGIAPRIGNGSSRSSSRPRPGSRSGGDRARLDALEATRRASRRSDLARERAWGGEHLLLHAPAREGVVMTGERVLVVEDNEKNMKLFCDVLSASGYRTIEATTGGEAVDLTMEHQPDLVLMDIQLPDIDGVQALQRLRADDRTAAIPVLARRHRRCWGTANASSRRVSTATSRSR